MKTIYIPSNQNCLFAVKVHRYEPTSISLFSRFWPWRIASWQTPRFLRVLLNKILVFRCPSWVVYCLKVIHMFSIPIISISLHFFHRSTILYMDYTCTCIHFKILLYRKSLIIPYVYSILRGSLGTFLLETIGWTCSNPQNMGGYWGFPISAMGSIKKKNAGSTFIPYGSKHEKVRLTPSHHTPKTS